MPGTINVGLGRDILLKDRGTLGMGLSLWKPFRVHVQSFITRREAAKRKLEKRERDFWTVADPEIDAWMLVTG